MSICPAATDTATRRDHETCAPARNDILYEHCVRSDEGYYVVIIINHPFSNMSTKNTKRNITPLGDRVLVHIAQLIRSHCRENDVAARYGGEEFIILHPSIDRQNAFQVAEGIRKGVESTPYLHERNEIGITLSAGVVDTNTCVDCPRIDDFLGLADKALYRAKDAGRNQVIVFDE